MKYAALTYRSTWAIGLALALCIAASSAVAQLNPLSIGTLPEGKSVTITFDVTVDDPLSPGGTNQVSNQATVSGSNFADVLTDDPDTGAASDATLTAVPQADLSITDSDSPDPVLATNTLTYTLNVSNSGPDDALNVVVTDTLPAEVTFASAMSANLGSGVCSESGGVVTCNLGTLPNGGSDTITIQATVDGGTKGDISNTSSIVSSTNDPNTANNMVSETTNVDIETTTAVTSSANPSVFGQSVTFTATVTPDSGAMVPTGTVTFKNGAATLGTGMLDGSGQATLSTSNLGVSSHSITAEYGGDADYRPSTSPVLTQTVDKANTATAVVSSANPSVFGQSVTFTATVSPVAPGAGTPTGTITFKDGATTLGMDTLDGSGQGSFATSALSAGPHSITVEYSGDGNFNGNVSSQLNQQVDPADTTTSLTSSTNPTSFGQSTTFTATVTPVAPGAGTPTGVVTFKDGGSTIGTDTVDGSGQAALASSGLTAGTHTITAEYGGDASFNSSVSPDLSQQVNKADTTSAVVSSKNPTVFGESITFTVTVSVSAPGSGTPTGMVTFNDGATAIGTDMLDGSGQGSFTTSATSVAAHTITVDYAGDSNFNGSTSPAITQTVNQADTSTALLSSMNPTAEGQAVTFTASVTVDAPGMGSPTGTVVFKDGAATLGTEPLDGSGDALFTTSSLSVGVHAVTAEYSGDGSFNGSASPAVNQEVLPAALTVDTLTDENDGDFSAGDLSLREAVAGIGPTGVISFTPGLSGTISLDPGLGPIVVTRTLDVMGPGADVISVESGSSRVFTVDDGDSNVADVSISGISITGGAEPASTGGLVYNAENLIVTNSVLMGGDAASGGLFSNTGDLAVTDSTLSMGQADFGGGIFNDAGTATILRSTISNSTAAMDGGGIYNVSGGMVSVTNSTISGNSADGSGGGMFAEATSASIVTNSTIAMNTTDAANSDNGNGGGIFNAGGTFALQNSIVLSNFDTNGNGGLGTIHPDLSGAFSGDQNNLVGDTTGATGLGASDITGILDPTTVIDIMLADNGGPTETHALVPFSPAIDAGDNTAVTAPPFKGLAITDQRGAGFDRIENGTVDIGAFELTFETESPSATIEQSGGQPDPTNTLPISFDVQFSEPVTGFEASDVVNTGTAAGIVFSIAAIDAATYTISADSVAADGAVAPEIPADAVQDTWGNGNLVSTGVDNSVVLDRQSPSALLTTSSEADTNAAPIPFTVTFDEPVFGFTVDDIEVSGGTAATFTGSDGDTIFTFNVSPSDNGTVSARVPNGVASDNAGNENTASETVSVVFDDMRPTLTVSSSAPDPTNVSPIPVEVVFDEPVFGFVASDVVVDNGSVMNFVGSDGDTTYTLDIVPSSDGAVSASVDMNAAQDAAGNGNEAAVPLSRVFDSTPPAVTISSTETDATNVSPFPVTVTFSESVFGFEDSDLAVSGAAVARTSGADGDAVYTFDLTPTVEDDVVTAQVMAGVAMDAAGNGNEAADPAFSIFFNAVGPDVTLSSAAPDPVSGPFMVSVQFSDSVTGFELPDAAVTNGSIGAGSTIGDTSAELEIVPSADGEVTVQIPAGAAMDSLGNPTLESNMISRTFTSPDVTVTLSTPLTSPTAEVPIPVTAEFSEDVTGLEAENIFVTNGIVRDFGGSGSIFMFDVVPILNGEVVVSLPKGAAESDAGQPSEASNDLSVTFASEGPVIAPSSPSINRTATGPVFYTITYTGAEDIMLTTDDVLLNTTGTATGTVSVSGEGTTERTVTIADISGEGTLSITVVAGTSMDAEGDPSAGFGPSDPVEVDPAAQACLGTPQNVRATDGLSFLAVVVRWEEVIGADHYEIYRGEEPEFDEATLIGTSRFTHFADFNAPQPQQPGFGCFGDGDLERFYWVVAVADCGTSEPSAPDVGSRGIVGLIVFQVAFPTKSDDVGNRIAAPDSALGVRLKSEEPIDPASVWGSVVSNELSSDDIYWLPVAEGVENDGWAVFRPSRPWTVGSRVTMIAGAQTESGQPIGPHAFTFEIQDPDEAEATSSSDSQVTGVPAENGLRLATVQEIANENVPALEGAAGPAYRIGPDTVFEEPRMAWLPLPEGVGIDEVSIWYYLADGELPGWYEGGMVDGWLVNDELTPYRADGKTYVGFQVRHGGAVHLVLDSGSAATYEASASGNGLGHWILITLAAAACVFAGRKRRAR